MIIKRLFEISLYISAFRKVLPSLFWCFEQICIL